jgi:SNF2 family DNA or RNA helicase
MFKGKVRNLWGILNWTRPEQYTGRWNWINSFFDSEKNAWGGADISNDVREDRVDAFHRELSQFMIRRTKDELWRLNPAWAPPPRSYFDVWCEMESEQARIYREMETNAVVNFGDEQLSATGVLAEMTRLKQFASSAGRLGEDGQFIPRLPSGKFDRLWDHLDELGIFTEGETNKVVIASQFTQLIELFAAEFTAKGVENFQITGKTSLRNRDAYQQAFQDRTNPVRVMFLNTMAGGVSITLDAADDICILDETWIPDDQDQVEGRVHRTSDVTHRVNCWYFRTLGTIEEGIMETVSERDIAQRAHLDGRRGVEYARRLAEQRSAA